MPGPSDPGQQTPASILQLLGISCEFASPSASSSSSTAVVRRGGHRHSFPMTLYLPSSGCACRTTHTACNTADSTTRNAFIPIWAALILITLTSPNYSVTVCWKGQRDLCSSIQAFHVASHRLIQESGIVFLLTEGFITYIRPHITFVLLQRGTTPFR